MDNGFHFISGLPRSGSTLLGALLKQNPSIHASMSSPVASLVSRVLGGMGPQAEFSSMITQKQRRDLVRSVFEAYYRDILVDKVVIDTSRGWCGKMNLLVDLFPQAKVIVCVRELAWVIDSFERITRKSPLIASKMFRPEQALTVFTRAQTMAAPRGTVGLPFNVTQEAFYGPFADRLIVVDYEALAREPKRTMGIIYEELGLPAFEHDFDNVTFDGGDEFDTQIGVPGLHTIKSKVSYVERPTVLPPDLFDRYAGRNFWRRPDGNPRGVKVILPSTPQEPGRRFAGVGMGRRPPMGPPPAGA